MQKNCRYVQFTTPRKYLLDGLWYGGEKPTRAIVFVHGLASTAFAHHDYLAPLSGKNTAVIFFSNRGHDKVARIKKLDRSSARGYVSEIAGQTHEIFTDCVDDIQGIVDYLSGKKVKEIYLVGHSTGCQKSVYYLSQKGKQKKIRGVVLLCPVSDYAAVKKSVHPARLKRAEREARKLLARKKSHQVLPDTIWPDLLDAQRFLSLFTPNSKEEIFTYAQPKKTPKILQKIKIPLLAVFAGNDEYHDRDTQEIVDWFTAHIASLRGSVSVIPNAGHGFKGCENRVVQGVRAWLRTTR